MQDLVDFRPKEVGQDDRVGILARRKGLRARTRAQQNPARRSGSPSGGSARSARRGRPNTLSS